MSSSKSYWSKAEENTPWQAPGVRQLTLEELGLIYFIAHGPFNAKCLSQLVVGISFTFPEVISSHLSIAHGSVDSALTSLTEKGWIESDTEHGLILLPKLVQGADNASHLHSFIQRADKKLPECDVSRKYIQHVFERTATASQSWKSDSEVFTELLKDAQRAFPGVSFSGIAA